MGPTPLCCDGKAGMDTVKSKRTLLSHGMKPSLRALLLISNRQVVSSLGSALSDEQAVDPHWQEPGMGQSHLD